MRKLYIFCGVVILLYPRSYAQIISDLVNRVPHIIFYIDGDRDGYGDPSTRRITQGMYPDYVHYWVFNGLDCDDTNSDINPQTNWYRDLDGDGYGNENQSIVQCVQPENYVSNQLDCDDTNSNIHNERAWFFDGDHDGFGNPEDIITQCTQPDGYVSNASDVCPDYASFENNGCSAFGNENYIHTTTYLNAFSEAQLSTISASDKLENITYFDGLGRPKQQIAIGQSPTGKDIITPILYDAFGRQPKDHLPYVPGDTNNGAFRTGDQEAVLQSYYSGLHPNDFTEGIAASNPFSEKVLEASPLNRVLEQAAQGTDWAVGNGHTIKFDYQTNSTEEVRLFEVALTNTYEPTLIETGFYNSGELYKTITKDENHDGTSTKNHTAEEFKDKQGRVVLKRTFADSTNDDGSVSLEVPHDTYSRLRAPQLIEHAGAGTAGCKDWRFRAG